MKYSITIALIILFAFFVFKYRNVFETVYVFATLFNKKDITENFRSLPKYWPHNIAIHDHNKIAEFDKNNNIKLPETFKFNNTIYNLNDWLLSTGTTGLVVLQADSVTRATIFEQYFGDSKPEDHVISWSVGKTVVSMLIGIAINEGKIRSVDNLVQKYASFLKKTAYHDRTIRQVLQMSSGIQFDEKYDDLLSDINTMSYWIAFGGNLNTYVMTLPPNSDPGTTFSYKSIDTLILGMVLYGATGESLTSYFEKKILRKTGFESNCEWLTDYDDRELAFGALNMRTRDYARLGWLLLNEGSSPLDGSAVISPEWIREMLENNEQHLKPNYPKISGYGYQIWLPGDENYPNKSTGDYFAIGIFNQFIYVNPFKRIVIAKNSANHNYKYEKTKGSELTQSEQETIAALRTIADFIYISEI